MPAKPWMSDVWFRDEGTGAELWLYPSGNARVQWCEWKGEDLLAKVDALLAKRHLKRVELVANGNGHYSAHCVPKTLDRL